MRKKLYGTGIILGMFFAGTALTAGLSPLEKLGEGVYINKNLSVNRNQSCQSCHHPSAAFTDPDSQFPTSEGSTPGNFGGRNAPSAAYAGFSPKFHWDGELFIGGVFWDGRASGLAVTDTGNALPDGSLGLSGTLPTYDPMADQAKGPFQNPVEMSLAGIDQVVDFVIKNNQLYKMYLQAFPSPFNPDGTVKYPEAYNNIAKAIAAFERSTSVNKFSSRFDKFVAEYGGDVSLFGVEVIQIDTTGGLIEFRKYVGPPAGLTSNHLTQKELIGLALFNADSATQLAPVLGDAVPPNTVNGGMCYLCHLTTNHDTSVYGTNNLAAPGVYPPLLTDFSYDNLGIPVNLKIAELQGETPPPDIGLGAQVAIMQEALDGYSGTDNNGKFKVPSLRGVAKSPPYGHNGYFATLEEIVHFYNTRDIDSAGWPAAEVPDNVNKNELGNLGLTPTDEAAITAFLRTLTDQ